MERFYSNLDLSEIKIGPESRFPPGEEPVDGLPVGSLPVDEEAPRVVAVGLPEALTDNGREILKVSAKSRPSAVAGAIAGVVREARRAEVQAIGAGATNQAVKAIAIARDYLADDEINMICIPEFIDVVIESQERTAIRFIIEPR
jgi:stage V sporulation protein S